MRKLSLVLLFAVIVSLFMVGAVQAQDDEATCTPTQPDGWIVYTISAGDSLFAIARRAGTTVEALQRANCIRDPQVIRAGRDIFIPDPTDVDTNLDHLLRRCYNAGLSVQECRELVFGNDTNFAERCLNAGFTTEQCRRIWNALNDDDTISPFLRRCENAGFSAQECRRIYNWLYGENDGGDDVNSFLRRCLNAGFTEQQCRRIWNAQNDNDTDVNAFLRRCLNAGFTEQECRRIWNAQDDGDGTDTNPFLRRCLNAGFTEQQCRRLWNAQNDNDGTREERPVDVAPPVRDVTVVPPVRDVTPEPTPETNNTRPRGNGG
ncbi:MAG: LysM domain-containing protein [Aggregatilineales bacterium]